MGAILKVMDGWLCTYALCSRNFQNVKLRLDFVYDHFTATQILYEIKFWRIQTVQKCCFWQSLRCQVYQKSKFRVSKVAKNDIFGPFELAEIWFLLNLSGGKMIKFEQSQALTSQFESFWSIVIYFCIWFLQVSWIQHDNLHIISAGRYTYTSDTRFQVSTIWTFLNWILKF